MASLWCLHQSLLIILNPLWLPRFIHLNIMPLGSQTGGMVCHAAGVFLVEFTLGFQCSPVRGYVFPAFGGILGGCTSRYPGKNAGGYRSAEAGIVLLRQYLTYLIYGDKLAFWHLLHDAVHFQR